MEFSFSTGGHFEKWPKRAVSPRIFFGNIANIIHGSPLKKMIPLMEDHGGGGGVHGDPRWLMDYGTGMRISIYFLFNVIESELYNILFWTWDFIIDNVL